MPFVTNRGQMIHYSVEGQGPLVVLQHGLLMDGSSWKQSGVVQALSDRYRVACIDSLGHGLSDKPTDARLYDQDQRAGDIVAVIDDLGAEKAHLIGYSMGGWLSVGVAKHHPDRLASLVIGGWDLVDGRPKLLEGELTFDIFLEFARHMSPHLVGWVTPQVTPCLRACFNALGQLDGAERAVLELGAPVMLWNGQEDHYHTPMSAFAARHGLPYVASPGDHTAAAERPGAQALERLADFIDKARSRRQELAP